MRITLVRDDGKVNTMRTLRIEQLVEQMKVETKVCFKNERSPAFYASG